MSTIVSSSNESCSAVMDECSHWMLAKAEWVGLGWVAHTGQ